MSTTHYLHHTHIRADAWPYRHFTPKELASRGDGSLLVHHASVAMLDALRERIGAPLIITSAYRDPLHNARVGGAPLSLHKQGRAFDIALAGHNKHRLLASAKATGFTGFGLYYTFLHIDTGKPRQWGKW